MKHQPLVGALLASMALACSSKTKEAPDDPMLAAWRSDLALVVDELTRHHPAPFHKTPEADFRAAAAAFERALPGLTPEQRVIGLSRLVGLVGDSHTNVLPPVAFLALGLPLRLYWFPDGIYVIAAAEPYRAAIGARLTKVAGHPIDEVTTTLAGSFGWDAETFMRAQVPQYMTTVVALRGTGLAPAEGPIEVEVVDGGGVPRTLAIEPMVWRGPGPEASPPLYRKNLRASYWLEYLSESRTVYVQYNKCEDGKELPFATFTDQVAKVLDGQPTDRLVIDLRFNTGGNSDLIKPLLAAIEARPALRGRLFVILGRLTFSSGIIDAMWLDQTGAVLVGEPAGAATRHYGEIHRMPLPGTGGTFTHSTKWHDFGGDYPDAPLPPEVPAVQTAADYFAGKDPALDAILATPVPVTTAAAAPAPSTAPGAPAPAPAGP